MAYGWEAYYNRISSDFTAALSTAFSGRVPDQGLAGDEVSRLIAELRALGWLSTAKTCWRNYAQRYRYEGIPKAPRQTITR
jgi:hypothetical protein